MVLSLPIKREFLQVYQVTISRLLTQSDRLRKPYPNSYRYSLISFEECSEP